MLIAAIERVADSDDGGLVIDKWDLRMAMFRTDRQGASGKIQFFSNGERVLKHAAVAVIKRVDGAQFEEVKEIKTD